MVGESETKPGSDAAARAAEILRDGMDVWLSYAASWQRRATSGGTWSADHGRDDAAVLVAGLAPLAERAGDLAVELLRPWARAFEARRAGGDP